MLDSGEECDDGNSSDGDGCNSDCSPSGTEIWTRTYNGTANGADVAVDVVVDGGGSVFVAGYVTQNTTSIDGWARKFDADGGVLWTDTPFDPDAGEIDQGRGIAIDSSGNVVYCGYVTAPSTGEDMFVRKADANGNELWTSIVPGNPANSYPDWCRDVTIDANDGVFAAGLATVGATGNDNVLVALDGGSGDALWSVTYSGPGNPSNDQFNSVALTSDGRIVVAGSAYEASDDLDAIVQLYGSTGGAPLWQWTYGPSPLMTDTIEDVAADGDGILLVGSTGVAGGKRAIEARLDADGIVTELGVSDDVHLVKLTAITFDGTGALVLAGTHDGSGSNDFWVEKRSAAGDVLWTRIEDGEAGGDDNANEVAIGPSDEILVVGSEAVDGEGYNVWVRKYSP